MLMTYIYDYLISIVIYLRLDMTIYDYYMIYNMWYTNGRKLAFD